MMSNSCPRYYHWYYYYYSSYYCYWGLGFTGRHAMGLANLSRAPEAGP